MEILWSMKKFFIWKITNNTAMWNMEVIGLFEKIDVFRISTGGNYSWQWNYLLLTAVKFVLLLSSESHWALSVLFRFPVIGLISVQCVWFSVPTFMLLRSPCVCVSPIYAFKITMCVSVSPIYAFKITMCVSVSPSTLLRSPCVCVCVCVCVPFTFLKITMCVPGSPIYAYKITMCVCLCPLSALLRSPCVCVCVPHLCF
jgi:hypothetical protein